jgi:hypothetical protein
MTAKLLISIGKLQFFVHQVTDLGNNKSKNKQAM